MYAGILCTYAEMLIYVVPYQNLCTLASHYSFCKCSNINTIKSVSLRKNGFTVYCTLFVNCTNGKHFGLDQFLKRHICCVLIK